MRILIPLLLLSFLASAKVIKKKEAYATPIDSELENTTGLTTEEINPSPNPAPDSEAELLKDTTLRRGPVIKSAPYKKQIQAQEESAMDYSTTPEKRPKPKKQQK